MNILIVDDHDFVCLGLKATLLAKFTDAEVSLANNVDSALILLSSQDFDLAIVDLFMPGGKGGFSFIEEVSHSYKKLPIIVLSASENPAHIRQSIDTGAMGFMSKSDPQYVLFEAILTVLDGNIFIPKSLAGSLPDADRKHNEFALNGQSITEALTIRQLDILCCVAKGLSNKLIARELDLSENTVKVHVSAILRILQVTNRTQAGLLGQALVEPKLAIDNDRPER
ncbi:MAG TPA: DNA-binding response regulator [Porticoccaceae bacterium]|nr:DNA-binding response regulator [Porticoccaceae bacterium]